MRHASLICALGAVVLIAADASAQSYSRSPTYGEVSLRRGFLPDPHVINMTAGGSVDVNVGGCSYGYVANAPDYNLRYDTDGGTTLYIWAEASSDITLLVNDPYADWACNDDGYEGLNPIIEVPRAPDGLYNIWVGTYGTSTVSATLYISEIDPRGGGYTGGGGGGGGGRAGQPDYSLTANYGEISLDAGFYPDPYVVNLTAGGNVDVDVGSCSRGYVSAAPDLGLAYSSRGNTTLYIWAEGSSDLTLLVNTPSTQWICDDDSFTGSNPILVVPNARSGTYDIWVGTYGSSTASGTLYISEIDPRSGGGGGGGGQTRGAPDWSLSPTYGSVNLNQGFYPDPYVVDLTAGGSVDVDISGVCSVGYVANAPDFDLRYQASSGGKGGRGGGSNLYIYAEASSDITMLINTPDGRWLCNDDGFTGVNPLVQVPRAESGLYNIWVGTYGSTNVSATLYISEINPPQ